MSIVSAFLAHRNGLDQTGGTHLQYSFVKCRAAPINIGGHFNVATGLWSPPPGLVEISAMVWWAGGTFAPLSFTQPNAACVKIYKNGLAVELKAAPGYTPSGYANTAGAALPPFLDICEEGDEYGLWAYGTSKNAANDLVIDGHHAHTWWCGKAYGA